MITCLLAIVIGSVVIITSNILLINKANKYTKKYVAKDDNVQSVENNSNNVDIYEEGIISASIKNDENKDIKSDIENAEENKTQKEENNIVTPKPKVQKVEDLTKINFTLLGEIMMGGQVTENVNYIYSSAFKDIHLYTEGADFTYATLGTNITNADKLENPKSKYIVTKDIINGLSGLGIDSVSVATDHMIDYPSNIFSTTKSLLQKYDILVAGQKDTPVYFEKGEQKVAIVSTNSVLLGTRNLYDDIGISTYDEENFKKNIREAKKIADVVIADVHWGKEYEYKANSQMNEIAHIAIDEGADLVIGSHALGVYPVITYKDKPIIYSAGYFISDTDYYAGRDSFIFDLEISDKKIKSLTMTPIYIYNKKEVKLYIEYNIETANDILNMYNNWHLENGLNSTIEDSKIVIDF